MDVAGGSRCPFCLWPITDDDASVTCGHCRVSYHEECYAANGACTTFGCPGWAQRPLGGAPVEAVPIAASAAAPGRISIALDDEPEPVSDSAVTPAPVGAFCDQCGTPVAPGDRFCAGCGHTLGGQP